MRMVLAVDVGDFPANLVLEQVGSVLLQDVLDVSFMCLAEEGIEEISSVIVRVDRLPRNNVDGLFVESCSFRRTVVGRLRRRDEEWTEHRLAREYLGRSVILCVVRGRDLGVLPVTGAVLLLVKFEALVDLLPRRVLPQMMMVVRCSQGSVRRQRATASEPRAVVLAGRKHPPHLGLRVVLPVAIDLVEAVHDDSLAGDSGVVRQGESERSNRQRVLRSFVRPSRSGKSPRGSGPGPSRVTSALRTVWSPRGVVVREGLSERGRGLGGIGGEADVPRTFAVQATSSYEPRVRHE